MHRIVCIKLEHYSIIRVLQLVQQLTIIYLWFLVIMYIGIARVFLAIRYINMVRNMETFLITSHSRGS